MNKIWIIIKREILTRVRKRSFIVMTILGPVFFAALFILPVLFTTMQSKEVKRIAVIDSSRVFINKLPETKYLKFDYLANTEVEEVKKRFDELNYDALLYIGHIIHYSPDAVQLMSYKQPSMAVTMHITNAIEKEIERQKLKTYDIENLDHILRSVKTDVNVQTVKWMRDGGSKKSHAGIAMAVSYLSGFLMYLLILIFGATLMRGIIEEKNSRIVEVIISSVRPFKLMTGKITGIAMVGLIQFVCWIVLTTVIIVSFQSIIKPDIADVMQQNTPQSIMSTSTLGQEQEITTEEMTHLREFLYATKSIDIVVMLASFLFFFISGYLLYAAMFAAVGSMVGTDTETQQFMLPVTIPLIIGLMVMFNVMNNPDSSLAFWFSMIPFTSPIVMISRIPFGVHYVEVFISALILVATIILFIWLSAKIYRTGILMYGKKITFKEVWRWLRYR